MSRAKAVAYVMTIRKFSCLLSSTWLGFCSTTAQPILRYQYNRGKNSCCSFAISLAWWRTCVRKNLILSIATSLRRTYGFLPSPWSRQLTCSLSNTTLDLLLFCRANDIRYLYKQGQILLPRFRYIVCLPWRTFVRKIIETSTSTLCALLSYGFFTIHTFHS